MVDHPRTDAPPARLDPKAWIENQSPEELASWIKCRLQGSDTLFRMDVRQDELPHSLIERLYPDLDAGTRRSIERIVVGFVRDMARNPASPWRSEAGDELLLLSQFVCKDLTEEYLALARDQSLVPSRPGEAELDLHFRALQSLLEARWTGNGDWQEAREFWKAEERRSPRYAGAAFDGLALLGPEHALALLPDLPWTEEVADEILDSLLDLMDEWGRSKVLYLLGQQWPHLTGRLRREIDELLQDEGIRIAFGSQAVGAVETPEEAPSIARYHAALGVLRRCGQKAEVLAGAGV